jgi:hypothetical protein
MSNSNSSHYNPPSYHICQDKKKAGETLTVAFISRCLVHEAKILRNFRNAEELYQDMEAILTEKKFDKNYMYNIADIGGYQRAIATMVRYAPSPEKALAYANLFFKEKDEPFRTPSKELVILTNLIFVYKRKGTYEYMKAALELTKLALSIGIYKIDSKFYEDPYSKSLSFDNSLSVFEDVCSKVIMYFNMEFNSDKTDLVPAGSYS